MINRKFLAVVLAITASACTSEQPADQTAGQSEAAGKAAAAPEAIVSPSAPREVTVVLSEFHFATSDTVFKAGVPYRFVLRNEGREAHEWAVVPRGDTDEGNLLFEVEEEDLPSGATVVREFTFAEPGLYDFACYMPGHYSGGMVLPVRVVSASS